MPPKKKEPIADLSMHDITARVHFYGGAQAFSLEVFGNELAEREGYKEHSGLDAVRYFLMLKFGWLPREVRSMAVEDLRFAMAEEFSGWTLPPEARQSYPKESPA